MFSIFVKDLSEVCVLIRSGLNPMSSCKGSGLKDDVEENKIFNYPDFYCESKKKPFRYQVYPPNNFFTVSFGDAWLSAGGES